jgi:sulfite exporter TauE/SafE
VPTEVSFLTALIIGFLGSTHCIGMCGGIASIVTFDKSNLINQGPLRTTLSQVIAYNLGRISSYMIAGLLAGILGSTFIVASPQHGQTIASFVAAGLMIALGLYLTHWRNGLVYLEKLGNLIWKKISPIAQRFIPIENGYQAYGFGLIWGWLPCGLVYSALIWSPSTANP